MTTAKLLPSLRSHSSKLLKFKLLSLKQNKDQAKISQILSKFVSYPKDTVKGQSTAVNKKLYSHHPCSTAKKKF